MIYGNAGSIRDPLKHDLAPELCRSQNNDISTLTESDINHYQIQHIMNNWLGPLMTEFFLFMVHQGKSPGNSWLPTVSLKD